MKVLIGAAPGFMKPAWMQGNLISISKFRRHFHACKVRVGTELAKFVLLTGLSFLGRIQRGGPFGRKASQFTQVWMWRVSLEKF